MGKTKKEPSALRKDTGKILKAGYKSQKDAAADLADTHTLDKDLSSMDTKVFVNKETGKPVIIHRGTQTLKDVGTDVLVGMGLSRYSRRFQRAKKVTAEAERKYGQAADAVGHSLGGNIAEHSGNHGETITLNKAVGLRDLYTKKKPSQTDIYTEGDIVGLPGYLTQRNKNKEYIKNTSGAGVLNAHKVDNLIVHDQDAQITNAKVGGHVPPHHREHKLWTSAEPPHRPGTVNVAEVEFMNDAQIDNPNVIQGNWGGDNELLDDANMNFAMRFVGQQINNTIPTAFRADNFIEEDPDFDS